MIIVLEVVALFLLAVTLALSLSHMLELPGKMRLDREQYLAVQTIYYPGFTYAGASEPIAILALVLLAFMSTTAPGFWLICGALIAVTLTHLLYWVLTAPLNKFWLKDQKLSGGAESFFDSGSKIVGDPDWMALRDRWEWSHAYRAIAAMTAFLLLTIAVAMKSI